MLDFLVWAWVAVVICFFAVFVRLSIPDFNARPIGKQLLEPRARRRSAGAW